MSYYNPISWIPPQDHLIPSVEAKIIADKRAFTSKSRRSKSFLPPYSLELDVLINGTSEMLRLTLTKENQEKVSINLSAGDDALRKGHFNHGYHHNPDGIDIPPPNHIHFPTNDYPLLDRPHTYAYVVKSDNDYLSALKKLCSDTNISLHNAALPLLRR